MPSRLLVAYTAVWRFFLTYLTVVAGGAVLFRWLQADSRRIGMPSADPVAADRGGAGGG